MGEESPAPWRGVFQYDYRSAIQGKDVEYAGVWMHQSQDSTDEAETVAIWDANRWDWAGATADDSQIHLVDVAEAFPGACGFGPDICLDVTEKLRQWQLVGDFQGNWGGTFGLTGDESDPGLWGDRYSYKYFAPDQTKLVLNVNNRPLAPTLTAPANNALSVTTTTPTLAWNPVTDTDGDVKYTAMIATGSDGQSGLVATSPASTATSWAVPADVLRDGVKYYWKVFAVDGGSGTSAPSEVRNITIDRRAGNGGLSPTDAAGGVSTNLVTGNASLNVPGVTMSSVGGGVGVGLQYNSQAETRGLVGKYYKDENKDRKFDTDDDLMLVRTDSLVRFDWGGESPSPAIPADDFLARWSGYVSLPQGNWQFGTRADDGTRVWIDDNQVVDAWTGGPIPATANYQSGSVAGNSLHQLKVEYFEGPGAAAIELWARNADNPSQSFVVPASWLSPSAGELPAGWTLQAADANVEYTKAQVTDGTVTLYGADGSTTAFTKVTTNGVVAYTPPAGISDIVVVNSDGTVTVQSEDGMTYVFRADGKLDKITSALDDRKPAAAKPDYNSSGQLTSLTDPVSGRSVKLTYAPSANCTETPPIPNGPSMGPAPAGMLCRVDYWDGTATELFYKNGLLGYVRNPGDAYWGFGYDTDGKLIQHHDPLALEVSLISAQWDKLYNEVHYAAGKVASVAQVTPLFHQERPTHSYTYNQDSTIYGELRSGTATVSRAGTDGPVRTVTYDARARTVEDKNATGETTKTTWDPAEDRVTAAEGPDGLKTTTIYDNLKRPTDTWGPAPASMFNGDGTGQAGVPHSVTRYDEGLEGLQAVWFNNQSRAGTPVVHSLMAGQVREAFPAELPAGVNATDSSARLTGKIFFPEAGTYQMQICVGPQSRARVYVDDRSVGDVNYTGTTGFQCSDVNAPANGFAAAAAGEARRLRIDFTNVSGAELLHFNWRTPSGAYDGVPAAALKPDLGLVTSTVDPDGKTTTTEHVDTAAGITPVHGLATKTIIDPGGLNLTETTQYETVGSGYLRRLSRTLPAGPGTKTTNTYYGDTEERDNPCTSADDPANQGGMLKLDTAADPDGTGPESALVRESIYDNSGRVVASRIGSEDYTCTSYDSRGRATAVKYPAFGGQSARTVSYDYAADPDGAGPASGSPMVQTVSDPSGTVMTETNLVGQPTRYTDVWGNATEFYYDLAGREIANTGPAGQVAKTYDNLDRLTSLTRNGAVLAEGLVYKPGGQLASVNYPTGDGKAGNGTSGSFGYSQLGRLDNVTWNGPAGLITSDDVKRTVGGDVVDQIVDGSDHRAGLDYVYDKAGRLTDAWTPGQHVSYQFAGSGGCGPLATAGANTNRTAQIIEGGPTTDYCYDNADRLVSATDAAVGAIKYDGHGNSTEIYGETHGYDSADRHMVTTKADTTVTYVRDATDRIVERDVNGETVARYGSTGSGDASDFTLDTNGAVLEVTFSLPGGAMVTTRAEGNVWSYPNIHGDVVATADQAGVKQGPTTTYDPYGNLVGTSTTPDNSAGDLDYGWLGQHQRPLEHQPTLQPVIEMGARQYNPLLGRFLEVDPIEGGSANDYDYTNADPINAKDLDGNFPSWDPVGDVRKFVSKHTKGARKWAGRQAGSISRTFRGNMRAFGRGARASGRSLLRSFDLGSMGKYPGRRPLRGSERSLLGKAKGLWDGTSQGRGMWSIAKAIFSGKTPIPGLPPVFYVDNDCYGTCKQGPHV